MKQVLCFLLIMEYFSRLVTGIVRRLSLIPFVLLILLSYSIIGYNFVGVLAIALLQCEVVSGLQLNENKSCVFL